MYVRVYKLRRQGLRLRSGELDEGLVGDLRINDAGDTSFKRPALKAQLWAPTFSVVDRPVGLPLFDPTLVHMGPTSFSLAGIELVVIDGRVAEYVQVWRCTPADQEPPGRSTSELATGSASVAVATTRVP